MTVDGGALAGNVVTGSGGGAYAAGGTLTIQEATLAGNRATGGGGVFAFGGQVNINRSTLRGNEAGDGGGARTGINGAIAIVNSTLSGNEAAVSGGGVFNAGTMSLVNSTLTGNTAGVSGGGAEVYAGTLTIERSLVSGNAAPNGREARRVGGTAAANSRNLFGFGGNAGLSGITPGATDIVATKPLSGILGTLAANGGPTQTHALVKDSPAIDAAPSAACEAAPVGGLDQRGLARNANGDGLASANECDIGAFEAPGAGDPPPMPFKISVPVILR